MINPEAFDIQTFGITILKQIDAIRAYSGISAVAANESRINAFYRAIGLPAIVVGTQTTDGQIIDSLNTANNFDIQNLNSFDKVNTTQNFINREYAFSIPSNNTEVQLFLDYNPLALSSGVPIVAQGNINPNIAQTKLLRQRGLLFPMLVNGNLSIKPTTIRVAGAFLTDEQITVSGIVYNRPFLETVISLVLSGGGVVNSQIVKQIQGNLSLPSSVTTNTNNSVIIQIVQSLLSIINSLGSIVSDLCYDLGLVRDQYNNNLEINAENIPGQNLGILEFNGANNQLGSILSLQQNINQVQSMNQLLYTLINYDDSNDSSVSSNNAQNALLASNLYSTITDDPALDQESITVDNTIETLINENQSLAATLDLLLGQFSGISAVDILIIILALFLLDEKDLLGLLNDTSLNNMNKQKSTNFSRALGTVSEMTDAVSALESLVSSLYVAVDNLVNNNVVVQNTNNQLTGGQ